MSYTDIKERIGSKQAVCDWHMNFKERKASLVTLLSSSGLLFYVGGTFNNTIWDRKSICYFMRKLISVERQLKDCFHTVQLSIH